MKLLLLNYYVGIHQEVMELLERVGVCTYTRWTDVEGRISCGEPRENSHVWPGTNSALMVVTEERVADDLIREIEALNKGSQDEGVDVYVLDVERAVTAA